MRAFWSHNAALALAAVGWLALLLTACNSSTPAAQPSTPTPTSGATMKTHFWISNQSLGTGVSNVAMKVEVDGAVILDKSLDVGKQHNYTMVDKDLASGAHTVKATVANPSTTAQKSVGVNTETWVLVRFWYDPQSSYANQVSPSITIDSFDHNPGIK